MKLLISSVVIAAVALVAGSAMAADLPLKAPLAPAPVYGWTGFYVGGDAGVRGSLTNLTTDAFAFGPFPVRLTGTSNSEPMNGAAFRRGGYAGYNWQVAPTWVVGVEADAAWANDSVTLNGVFLPGPFALMPGQVGASLSTRATWDASARGRAGYLITPWTLV